MSTKPFRRGAWKKESQPVEVEPPCEPPKKRSKHWSAQQLADNEMKLGGEFGRLTHRIVTETEKTDPHLMRWTPSGHGFIVEGKRNELAPIMSKYFPRK
jgi:hypothetical protein